MVTRPEMGRFGVKLEGSGKRRAIANPLYQALVRPLHDWVMEILRDGWDFQSNGPSCQIAREIGWIFLRS